MDTFFGKLSQKTNSSSDMINANSQAEIRTLKRKIDEYESLLDRIQELTNEITITNEKTQEAASKTINKMDAIQAAAFAPTEDNGIDIEEIAKLLDDVKNELTSSNQKQNEYNHKENVKVYRNVQAAVDASLDKQTESITETIKNKKVATGILPITIVTMVLVIIDICVQFFGISVSWFF